MPAALRFKALPGEMPERAAERKELLSIARKHWEYAADELHREGLLATPDEGMLTGLALCYAQMVMAGQNGAVTQFVRLQQRYMQAADRMGLNESARARLPKRGDAEKNQMQSAMASFLKNRQPAA